MAVQAQYPSNILLPNRSVQEGKNPFANNYSLQPQPGGNGGGGGFLDQSHMLYNNGGGSNPRKRGRDLTNITTIATGATPLIMNQLMCLQSQPPPQLIDMNQLHTSQPNVVSTGLRLAFGDQPQQSQQPQQILSSPASFNLSSILSEDMASQIKQQRDEIDQLIQAQGEQLRRTLAEKTQRHQRALLGAIEESMSKRLREKDAEMEGAARRNAELEARAAQLSAEAQTWQAKARAQEITAATLREELRRAMTGGGCTAQQHQENRGEGRVMGHSSIGEAEDAESAYIDPDRVVPSAGPCCKACRKRAATMVLLPCRHLCLCWKCDGVAQSCPLCLTYRRSSVEALLS